MSSRHAFLVTSVAAIVVFAGCGKKESGPSAAAAAVKAAAAGRTIPQIWKVSNGAEPQDIDPQTVVGSPELKLCQAFFEGLLTEDPKDLHPVPGLAESWDVSAEGRVYTFRLRPNLKWSNGDPILATEIVESYKRILSPKLGAEFAGLIYSYVLGAKDYFDGKTTDFSQVGFKAPDERTLQVTLRNPTPYLPKIIASHFA